MESVTKIEQDIIESIKNRFDIESIEIKRPLFISISIKENSMLHQLLSHMKSSLGFIMLTMIACTDWIEEDKFELSYILWSYEKNVQVMIKIKIDRENPSMKTITTLWEQAETFEREIHEMYGVDFLGNNRLTEFMLEDWKGMPPLRRDFDTAKFVEEEYEMRGGREDAKNVKEYMKLKRERKKREKETQQTKEAQQTKTD